jgi:hypothetical protein
MTAPAGEIFGGDQLDMPALPDFFFFHQGGNGRIRFQE